MSRDTQALTFKWLVGIIAAILFAIVGFVAREEINRVSVHDSRIQAIECTQSAIGAKLDSLNEGQKRIQSLLESHMFGSATARSSALAQPGGMN